MISGVLNSPATHARDAFAFCVVFGLLLSRSAFGAATGCDPWLTEQRALDEASIVLAGNERTARVIKLPQNTSVLVAAEEKGLDVSLEILESHRLLSRADNPIRRSGTQRALVATRESGAYTLSIVGKEHAGISGTVRLRVIALSPRAADDRCAEIHRLLAAADTAYGAGQGATRGLAATDARLDAPTLYKAAANAYKSAAERLERLGPSKLLGESEQAEAAVLYQDLNDWPGASTWAEHAARTFDAVQDEYGRARADALRGAALIEIGVSPQTPKVGQDPSRAADETLTRARALLTETAAFHARRGERYDEALALNNVGVAYYMHSQYDDAIRAYQSALLLYQQLGEKPRLAQVLQNIGLVEFELGRLSQAIPHFEQALAAVGTEGVNPMMSVTALSNSAIANLTAGNYDVALKQAGDALAIARNTKNTFQQAFVLHNIASIYYMLGDEKLALQFYDQSLKLSTVESDARGRLASLRAVANILREQGRAQEALSMHQQALSLASAAPVRAQIQVQIARDLSALARVDDASRQLESVLSQRFAGDDMVHARALLERARLGQASGMRANAETDLRTAMRTFVAFDAPQDQFDAWVALAQLERSTAPEEAFAAADKALALAEELRVQSASPDLRAIRLQPLRPAFDLKIAMLADRYFRSDSTARERERAALEALLTAEQARVRALEDFSNLDVTAPGVKPEIVARRRDIYRELAARRARLELTLDRAGSGDAHVAPIRADIATLRQELDQIDAQIGAASSTTRAVDRARLTRDALASRKLPADVAIVEYWIGNEGAYIWAVTREGIAMAKAGSAASLNGAARELHAALKGFGSVPKAQRLQLSEQLYDMALAPVEAPIAGKRRLLIAPDGALHYIPFATLRFADRGQRRFLIEAHDVAVIPSAGLLRAGVRAGTRLYPAKQMLLVDDPVYALDDARLATHATDTRASSTPAASRWLTLFRGAEDTSNLPRLPGTAQEATTIAQLLQPDQVDRLEGFTATRDRFLGLDLGHYRLIHVASHALTDSDVPQASALVLSTVDRQSQQIDGRVLAADFMNVRLNAEAVVLSACDTALGPSVAGEGLMGLRYVVLARGAQTVVASLWNAPDAATAQLMTQFYTSLLRDHRSGTAALADAMRLMLRGPFSDPSVWGAFAITVSTMDET